MSPKHRINNLPPYVYKRRHGYELRLYTGKGRPMKSVKLCPADAPLSEVWRHYENRTKRQAKTLSWLLSEYKNSEQFEVKALSTKLTQKGQIERISVYPTKAGKHFGDTALKLITHGVIRKYLDARSRDGSPVAGNRESALISAAWNWALERDIISHDNPIKLVKRNKEQYRTRYVTDNEYVVTYKLAARYPYLQPIMEMMYLCRMRSIEVLTSTRAQILPEGFDTLRTKGSKDAITLWSKRLREAVNYDKGKVTSIYIVHDKNGQAIKSTAVKSAWRRLKPLMVKAGIEPFNLHDLKAKAISDFKGNKLEASGHKDPKMLKVYDRKKTTVEATE